jgi:hypothetical protein
MGTHNRAVQEYILHIRVGSEMLMHIFQNTMITPASKSFIDTVPVLILLRKQSPLCSAAQNPVDCPNKKPTFILFASVGPGMALQK